ncbi:hypothetical protein T8K17_10695 [Thalassobaculum sp. OXR-137]|uniref:hypothetical protein n=1 Tax=Thalassobaculum sp. OXR-137 TaxID=3100173 RepID=UPI002AC99525|nr:hypothetical protein [Thalassobaculum sp. OXR-137]WPZ36604.1 hypothetical protein T8K17_10695 [Thalassobaculum sp. OXR-137]
MLHVLKLLLPALFPSWRFFDVIAPSPRIEVAAVADPDAPVPEEGGAGWRDLRPKRDRIGPSDRVVSFFWNPRWNEILFLATCAERLMQEPSEHSAREIVRRLRRDLAWERSQAPFFRFRLVFVSREGDRLRRDVAYVSPPLPTAEAADR